MFSSTGYNPIAYSQYTMPQQYNQAGGWNAYPGMYGQMNSNNSAADFGSIFGGQYNSQFYGTGFPYGQQWTGHSHHDSKHFDNYSPYSQQWGAYADPYANIYGNSSAFYGNGYNNPYSPYSSDPAFYSQLWNTPASSPFSPPASQSSVQQNDEAFMMHLVTSEHTPTIDQSTLGKHVDHHLQLGSLFNFFQTHASDFSSIPGAQQLLQDSGNYASEQLGMADEAAQFVGLFPNGASQDALNAADQMTNGDVAATGLSVNDILNIEQGTMDPSAGISAKDFIDTWATNVAKNPNGALSLSDIENAANSASEESAILNAVANDPNLTDPTLKSAASSHAAEAATQAQDLQWFATNFSAIAGVDGNPADISAQDIYNFVDSHVAASNGSAFNLAAEYPTNASISNNSNYSSLMSQWMAMFQQYYGQGYAGQPSVTG